LGLEYANRNSCELNGVAMNAPKISVITPSFNSIRTIRETIESVRTQDYTNWEHIVMDGGSRDGTIELLKQYPHLTWVSEKDEGHYHAMNKGIERATGEVVNILNSDDCYRAGALSAVAEGFGEHPEWDGLFGDIVYVTADGTEIYRREEAVFDYDVLRFSGICYVIHQTLFVRKTVHDRLGLYRHKEFRNSCDYDFILRLGQAGCRIGHVPKLLINYRYHEHGQSADLRVTNNMLREATIIRREHGAPTGFKGSIFRFLFRGKRQLQKLRYRGRIDVVSGNQILKKHMRAKTNFSSNTDFGKSLDGRGA
jgi:glycosyltransferase involved in cell wall biosynthesis